MVAATSCYFAKDDFLKYIYSVLAVKNHQMIRSRSLIYEFSFADILNDINHGYRTDLLKKNSFWLLPFYVTVATYCYCEKLRRTMRNAVVSYLNKCESIKNRMAQNVCNSYKKSLPLKVLFLHFPALNYFKTILNSFERLAWSNH